ncbi:FAS1-like dehydratase domain-containing protein [Nocardia brasiliensis]|uniref:FAS1-like dehydratase domain-containing protein n=1 Tax=Nocardia brasiliensis TaxID=37326 RepID=UPI003D8B477B
MKPVDYAADRAKEPAVGAGLAAFIDRRFRSPDYYDVGSASIREYASLIRCEHAAYKSRNAAEKLGYPGLLAPPTYFSLAATLIQRALLGAYVDGTGFRSIVLTSQQTESHRPIVAGDRLACETWIDTYRQTLGGDLIGLTTMLTDPSGAPVVTSRARLASRADLDERVGEIQNLLSGSITGSAPPSSPQRRRRGGDAAAPTVPAGGPRRAGFTAAHLRSFADISVGAELPARTVYLTSGDLVRYAGLGGDPNPVHWNPGLAGLFRLDSVVAHGMLTTGIGVGYVAGFLDDPGAISAYRIRLISPVFVGSQGAMIELRGRVKSIDREHRTVTMAIAARQEEREIFGRAAVTVRVRGGGDPVAVRSELSR